MLLCFYLFSHFLREDIPINCSPSGSVIKNLPVKQQMRVRSLDWKDPPEEEMATHSFLPGKFHGQRSRTGYSSRGRKKNQTQLNVQTTTIYPDIILGYTCLFFFFFFKRHPFPEASPNYPLLSLLEYYSSSPFLSLNISQGTI